MREGASRRVIALLNKKLVDTFFALSKANSVARAVVNRYTTTALAADVPSARTRFRSGHSQNCNFALICLCDIIGQTRIQIYFKHVVAK